MPPAARLSDPATHVAKPMSPGICSDNVKIGYMKAWRVLPAGMGAGIESASNTMKELMDAASLDPASTPAKLAKVVSGFSQEAGKAAAKGAPAAPGAVSGGATTLISANVALTATYTAAAAVPGGEPAARTAYTKGIQAAAAGFAAAAISAIAGMTDIHICPQPSGPIPHGPGVITKGSKSVLINNLPACREGDKIFEAAGGPDPVKKGCATVIIGDEGSGSGGAPGAPVMSLADQAALASEADSAAEALVEAAGSGAPLIVVGPPCGGLGGDDPLKHRVAFQVVDDETGEPQQGVRMRVRVPGEDERLLTTDGNGMVEITDIENPGPCEVTFELKDNTIKQTFDFVKVDSQGGGGGGGGGTISV